MASVQKIKLSPSRDIPFNKLVLSQSNVRRVKAGISIDQLVEGIAQRTLLQSLSVRAVVDVDDQQTGLFEVPAGGRRYRALEILVKQKRMAKKQPVPCVVRDGGIAEDDSLAENDERVGLHPPDQFRAFQGLRDGGMSEEEISARHFVSPAIVKQRLRLASVSPKLYQVYANDGMTREQLMAFSVTAEQARREQAWDSVRRSQLDEPYIVAGLLLPIWKRLPSESMRVCRLRTDIGERIIGRNVSPAWVAVALEVGTSNLSLDDAFTALIDGKTILDLAEGLQVGRVRVMGANRIECAGFTEPVRDRLRAFGLFGAIISWKLRFFVPVDTTGPAILAKVLQCFPIARTADRAAT